MNVIWETGLYKNEEIGKLFGISYSSVSKSIKGIIKLIKKDIDIKLDFEKYNSQFKALCPPTVAAAIADRLVSNSEVLILEGESYRKKKNK